MAARHIGGVIRNLKGQSMTAKHKLFVLVAFTIGAVAIGGWSRQAGDTQPRTPATGPIGKYALYISPDGRTQLLLDTVTGDTWRLTAVGDPLKSGDRLTAWTKIPRSDGPVNE